MVLAEFEKRVHSNDVSRALKLRGLRGPESNWLQDPPKETFTHTVTINTGIDIVLKLVFVCFLVLLLIHILPIFLQSWCLQLDSTAGNFSWLMRSAHRILAFQFISQLPYMFSSLKPILYRLFVLRIGIFGQEI